MKSQKPLTGQIISAAHNLITLIDSEQYKQQIRGNDIDTQNSPYKVGDYTLGESIDNLKSICRLIISKEDLIDTINYDLRNNIHTYLQNLYSWLTQNTIGNWNNIISYTTTIQQWLASFGISIFSESTKEIERKLKNINIKDSELTEVRELLDKLRPLMDASKTLENAKDTIEYAKQNISLKDTDTYINTTKEEIGKLQDQARDLLGASSHYALIKHFDDLSVRYKKRAYGNDFDSFNQHDTITNKMVTVLKNTYIFLFSGTIKYLVYSVIFLILNIFVVFLFREDLQISLHNEVIGLIGNGLIRLTCLSPSIIWLSFVLSEYKRLNSLREKYEFKSAISSTFEGHIITLDKYLDKGKDHLDNQTRNNFIGTTVLEIFSNPLNGDKTEVKEGEGKSLKFDEVKSFLETIKENSSLLDKIKEIFK